MHELFSRAHDGARNTHPSTLSFFSLFYFVLAELILIAAPGKQLNQNLRAFQVNQIPLIEGPKNRRLARDDHLGMPFGCGMSSRDDHSALSFRFHKYLRVESQWVEPVNTVVFYA